MSELSERQPDIFQAKRVLAVQPHYDDNDIAAGGTLAKLAARGAEIIYLTVTDDLVGVINQEQSEPEMVAALQGDQDRAGKLIGVRDQYWLGYPDAGKYDYFDVRRDIIKHIRLLRPDFVVTCDPWLPYEFHNDHIMTGRAAADAASLYNLTRLETDPEIDAVFEPFELLGIGFYASAYPNTTVDITDVWPQKRAAVAQYRAQFTTADMETLLGRLELWARQAATEHKFVMGEALKVMATWQLHLFPDALRS